MKRIKLRYVIRKHDDSTWARCTQMWTTASNDLDMVRDKHINLIAYNWIWYDIYDNELKQVIK